MENCLQSSLLQLFRDQQQVAACSAWCSSTSAEDFGTSSLEMVSPTHSHKVRRGCSSGGAMSRLVNGLVKNIKVTAPVLLTETQSHDVIRHENIENYYVHPHSD